MIPYFEQPRLALGPLTIHAFGVLVAVAVLVGHRMFRWKLKREGMDAVLGERLLTWVLVAASSAPTCSTGWCITRARRCGTRSAC
jgi:prolipoprotein diacylglyceryltransferase